MRVLLSMIFALLGYSFLQAGNATEYFNIGNPINYCGTEYHFAWSSHPQEDYYLQEYLPQGESPEHFNQMFTVSVRFWDRTAKECVEAKIAELQQRKKQDPVINYLVYENGNEYILEFVVSDSSDGKVNTVELNIHYYREMTIDDRKATVLEFYSHRAYGDDIMPFLESIPDKRVGWIEGMIGTTLTPSFPKK